MSATTTKAKKKHRIFLWVFLAVQALFIYMIVSGVASTNPKDDAEAAGAGIGVMLLLLGWFFVDAFLGVVYGVYRLARRPER